MTIKHTKPVFDTSSLSEKTFQSDTTVIDLWSKHAMIRRSINYGEPDKQEIYHG